MQQVFFKPQKISLPLVGKKGLIELTTHMEGVTGDFFQIKRQILFMRI